MGHDSTRCEADFWARIASLSSGILLHRDCQSGGKHCGYWTYSPEHPMQEEGPDAEISCWACHREVEEDEVECDECNYCQHIRCHCGDDDEKFVSMIKITVVQKTGTADVYTVEQEYSEERPRAGPDHITFPSLCMACCLKVKQAVELINRSTALFGEVLNHSLPPEITGLASEYLVKASYTCFQCHPEQIDYNDS